MAATFLAIGSAVTGSTTLSPVCPASIAAGNLLLLHIASKYPTNGPAAPTGWTLVPNGQASGGSGSSATDTGSVYSTVYYKIADGTESGTTVTVTLTSVNQGVACITRSSVSSGRTPSLSAVTGSQNTATSSWSVAASGGPGTLGGDVIFVTAAINTNLYTYTSEAITGLSPNTMGAETERKDSGSGGGDHVGLMVSTHLIASSYGTATPTFTMTASGTATDNPCGAVVFIRFRELYLPTTGTPPVFAFLTCTTNSFAETGSTATLTKVSTLSLAAGSFAETGSAATLALTMPLTAGSFAETGSTATLTVQRLISASTGSFAETGNATAFSLSIPLAAGSFAETGSAATLAVAMPFTAGSFAETGTTATLTVQRRISAVAGSFAETGSAAILALTMPLTAGSFVETGTTATLTKVSTLPFTAGSFAETGRTATLTKVSTLSLASGSFAETGIATTLALMMPLVAGSFAETGSAVTLALTMPLAAGAFAETGNDVTLALTMPLTAGSFAETGSSATFSLSIPITAGAFAETGSDATFIRGLKSSLDTGVFTETGAALVVTRTKIVPLDTGVFADTGIDINLVYQANGTLAGMIGVFGETGISAELLVHRKIFAITESFSETSTPIALIRSLKPTLETGSYLMNGKVAKIQSHRQLYSDPGSFVETGFLAYLAVFPSRLRPHVIAGILTKIKTESTLHKR